MERRENQRIEGQPENDAESKAVQEFRLAFPLMDRRHEIDCTTIYHTAIGFLRARGINEGAANRLARFLTDLLSEKEAIW